MAPAKKEEGATKKGKGRPKGSVKKPKSASKPKAEKVKSAAKKYKIEKTTFNLLQLIVKILDLTLSTAFKNHFRPFIC